MEQHMRTFNKCAKYAAATIMYASNGSDSETDSISPQLEGNVPNNNDNCSIGIDVGNDNNDDDDDNRRAWILGEILRASMLHRGLASLQSKNSQIGMSYL